MAVNLSIVVATIGRRTLGRTIRTIAEQVQPGDEVLLVQARGVTLEPFWVRYDTAAWRVLRCLDRSNHGDAEKNLAIRHATGTHLVFMDDDDVYLPGALDAMRERAGDVPAIFRMIHPLLGTLWTEPVLRYGNVSTQMFVVPNTPGKLGTWAPHVNTEGTDYTFLTGCCDLMGDPVWDERVVAEVRPE